jgi:hypothetical protein
VRDSNETVAVSGIIRRMRAAKLVSRFPMRNHPIAMSMFRYVATTC